MAQADIVKQVRKADPRMSLTHLLQDLNTPFGGLQIEQRYVSFPCEVLCGNPRVCRFLIGSSEIKELREEIERTKQVSEKSLEQLRVSHVSLCLHPPTSILRSPIFKRMHSHPYSLSAL